jgi:hypothetical protein
MDIMRYRLINKEEELIQFVFHDITKKKNIDNSDESTRNTDYSRCF